MTFTERIIAEKQDVKHPECDPCRDRLDRALAQNCGKEHPLIPFSERYADLKQVSYGRKR